AWRDFLDGAPPPALRTLGEGLMLRAHRLLQVAGELPPGPAGDLESATLHTVGVGLADLAATCRIEVELASGDTHALWEAIEAATTRARFASSPARAAAEQARCRQLLEALRQLGAREEERTRSIQRVLSLCTSLERARRQAERVIAHAEGTDEARRQARLREATARLDRDSRLLAAAVDEVAGLGGEAR
ncbi:MAG: hypothetical protein D6798_01305, partial [Deltaproteobacteria bacterium]